MKKTITNNNHKNTTSTIAMIIGSFLFIIAVVISVKGAVSPFLSSFFATRTFEDDNWYSEDEKDANSMPTYVKETCYNGGEKLPRELFDIPFSEGGNYKKNLDYIQELTTDEIDTCIETLETVSNLLFSSRDTAASIPDKIAEIVLTHGSFSYGGTIYNIQSGQSKILEIANDAKEWYIATKKVLSCEFVTDKSLIWRQDGVTKLRGMVSVTSEENENIKEENSGNTYELFGKYLPSANETKDIIVEGYFVRTDNGPLMIDFRVLD